MCSRSHIESNNISYLPLSIKYKYLTRKSFVFVIPVVQWWKLYYVYIFFTKRMRDFNKLKRNMNDVIIVFLMSCFSFLSAIQSFIIRVTWTLRRKFILFRSKAPEVFFKVNLQIWKWHIWMGVPAKNLLRICRTPFSKSTSGFFIFLKK